ncbi:hypothetical protein LTR56_011189 [Elasticomyces elasticus]|nr:hypothetical protein LTR56_011189 [Elasticomyces elasticus]
MPRSRLKSRLSPEQAQGITYPASPPLPSPRLASNGDNSYNERGPIVNGVRAVHAYAEHHIHGHHHHEDPHYPHHNHHRHQAEQQDVGHCTCGDHEGGEIPDSGDEEVEFDHPDYRYTPAAGTPTPAGYPGHVHEMVAAREIAAMAGGKQPPPLDSVQRRLIEARLGGGNNAGGNGKILPPPGSTASSSAGGDGYESFENTSNKKKRKIPLSGASSTLHQSSLSAEMASMEISGQTDGAADDVGGVQQQSASYTSPGVAVGAGTGISGAGRGRYGRSGNVNAYRNGLRRPLTNGTVNMAGGAGELMNGDDTFETTTTGGIISQAIKSAAEQGPLTPQKAGTNGKTLSSPSQSLLQSATTSSSNSNTTTPKTQFTFHVDSESATKMADHEAAAANAAGTAYAQAAYAATAPQMPGSYPTAPSVLVPGGRGAGGQYANSTTPGNNAGGGRSTQGTQTTPSLRGGAPANHPSRLPPPPATTATGQQQPQQQQQQPPKPKPRRRPSKEYALAARQRQLQQEYSNFHHRPTKDSMWICEFCEYEDIFGTPPLALIRSYEVKDRKERKAKAERRRLLEKAKMKGRKNKKGSKKAGNAGGAPGNGGGGGTAPGPVNGEGGRGYDARLDGGVPPGEEEYYDDDEGGYGEGSLEGEGDEYEPEGGEGEYEDAYYAPPAATAAVRGSGVQGGGGGVGKLGGEVREEGRA